MNDKWWSVLFGIVMFACGALFVVAPIVGWWMPQGVSSHSWDVDWLFYLILAITGFFFILTEALLVIFMFRYTPCPPGTVCKPSMWWPLFKPLADIFNTAKKIEMAWTVVPAVILVYLAVTQVGAWEEVKYKKRLKVALAKEQAVVPVQLDVSARQFEWRIRYPSVATWLKWKDDWKNKHELVVSWAKNHYFDDIRGVPNEVHVIMGHHVVVQLSTKDVLHSFNIPHMRVKQDALPGKIIPTWFKPIDYNVEPVGMDGKVIENVTPENEATIVRWQFRGGHDAETGKPTNPHYVWQIACAELCGWGHARMIGQLKVHKDEASFLAWLKTREAQQNNFGTIATHP